MLTGHAEPPVAAAEDHGALTRRVVDSLRAFAQEHGVGLDRIVVNGREFWRRPDLSQRQE